ncbi:hypothetical protein [Streptomyces sp. JJ38]|uniref:hypothetical protein n=1 Tax=Streptomyces sp. JJ38 TaxID=2738128 RepID=UPI001C56CDFF|nr:hypothetical protein [Streptomyces sp. JJ38]MBW1598968.1 hypothetical protein [Streptomyces sp. JJ38]
MGSLRNPVGPLPSSIYWRRRAVAASVVALLLLLLVWMFNLGDGDGETRGQANTGRDDERAASSITPGPSSTESRDDTRPGGRDEADGGSGEGSSGSDGDAGGGSGGGSDEGDAGGDGAKNGDDEPGGGASGGGNGGTAGLPACTSGQVRLSLVAVENTYAPGERPRLRLTVDNSGGSDCRVAVGPGQAVVTITLAGDEDETVWSSDHCAEDGDTAQLRVPARDKAGHTIEWDRRGSAPDCPKSSRDAAAPGTYLAEVKAPGLGTAQTSFVLAKD